MDERAGFKSIIPGGIRSKPGFPGCLSLHLGTDRRCGQRDKEGRYLVYMKKRSVTGRQPYIEQPYVFVFQGHFVSRFLPNGHLAERGGYGKNKCCKKDQCPCHVSINTRYE